MHRGSPPEAPLPFAAGGESEPTVSVRARGAMRHLRIDQVRLIVACENYSEITFIDGRHLLVRRTMQEWTDLLPPAQFARVHRGLIVNLDHVSGVDRGEQHSARLRFRSPLAATLEVKRRHWPALRRRFEAWQQERIRRRSASGGKSIAVLPFADFSRSPAGEIFCDGITEELINVLAKAPGLRVAARTSVFHFKNTSLRLDDIAQQLGVDYVVEGSARVQHRGVRITAQLIEAATGFHLWSDTFDRDLTDILAVQDEIAALILRNLQLKLAASPRPARLHPEAHRLALEGRHYWNLRTSLGFVRAEQAFTKALALEPSFAAAHASLADLWVVRAMYRLADGERDVSDDLRRVHTAAQRALELDPHLGAPHAALGFARFHEGRLEEAAALFPTALALNPNYATGRQFYAWTLAGLGRLDDALDEYTRAIALDPLSFINLDRHAAMLALAGRHAEALDSSERSAALRPDFFVGNLSQRAPILLALGRTGEAVAAARTVRDQRDATLFRRNSDADAIWVLHAAGQGDEAAAYADEVLARLTTENYLRGFILAAAGRHADAWPALATTPSIMLPQLYWSPLWREVRGTAAFEKLIALLGRTTEYRRAAP